MKLTKPTPGPWRVAASGLSVNAGHVKIRQERGAPADELKANAHLIAAAPRLLSALHDLVRQVEDEDASTGKGGNPAYHTRRMKAAREAIAAARGKGPA